MKRRKIKKLMKGLSEEAVYYGCLDLKNFRDVTRIKNQNRKYHRYAIQRSAQHYYGRDMMLPF